MLGDKTFVW